MPAHAHHGTVVEDEIAVADAHPLGARPFARDQYVAKFRTLAEGLVTEVEQDRFLEVVQHTPELAAGELHQLTVALSPEALGDAPHIPGGIF